MNYDRGYSSNQVTRALTEFVISDAPLVKRLQAARGHLNHFVSENNCQDLRQEARHFLQQLLEVKDFNSIAPEKHLAAAGVFVDFICFAKEDFAIADYKDKANRKK